MTVRNDPEPLSRFGVTATARAHPDRLAVVDDEGFALTYAELDRLVSQVIRALGRMGVEEGEPFCILAINRGEVLVAHHAAFRGGFWFTPLNPMLRRSEIGYIVRDSGARVLLVDAEHRELAREATSELAGMRIIDLHGAGPDTLFGLAAQESPDPVPYRFGSVMAYTSGTTGRPKAVVRDRIRPSDAQLEAMLTFGLRVGMDPHHDRHLATAPLSHGGPMIAAMHSVNLGGTVRIMRRFDAERVLDLIAAERITSSYMVPTMYHRLLRLPEKVTAAKDLRGLRSVFHTGAPCPVNVKQRMLEWLGPVVYECYAATEGLGAFTVCTPEDAITHPGTVGRPLPGSMTARAPDGSILPPGEHGVLYTATLPGVAPFRYKDDEQKTAEAYADDGTFTVGDLGYLDEDGYLYVTGRQGDMVISGGVNVYPAEVEERLLAHPAVVDAAVIGLPDDEWGERVVAVVQPDPSLVAGKDLGNEIIAHCREGLAAYKCPKAVLFRQALGRHANGKLRRDILRDTILQQPHTRSDLGRDATEAQR
jgi:long-chain acyl-CoA synthetase